MVIEQGCNLWFKREMTPDSHILPARRRAELLFPFLSGVVPTYDGPARLLDWNHSGRGGMTVDIALSLPGPLGGHPFRGMNAGKEGGQRFYMASTLARPTDGDAAMIHTGESLLLRWSENDRTGMMIRMLLDDGPDGVNGRNPFFGLSLGRMSGEPLEFVAWGVDDDEQGAPPSRIRRRTPFHQLTEVQQSNILCRDPRFREFLLNQIGVLVPDEETRASVLALQGDSAMFAQSAVRAALGVTSRAVMNKDGAAAQLAIEKWRTLLGRYDDWVYGIRRR